MQHEVYRSATAVVKTSTVAERLEIFSLANGRMISAIPGEVELALGRAKSFADNFVEPPQEPEVDVRPGLVNYGNRALELEGKPERLALADLPDRRGNLTD